MLPRLSAKARLRDGHNVLRLPSLREGDQPHAAGGRSLHLARILETHGIRSLLINALAFILLFRDQDVMHNGSGVGVRTKANPLECYAIRVRL